MARELDYGNLEESDYKYRTRSPKTFYHITRTANVPNILKEGLRTTRKGLGRGFTNDGFTRHFSGIFLTDDKAYAVGTLLSFMDAGKYTLLKVTVPKGYVVHADPDEPAPSLTSHWVITKSIPPGNIRVVSDIKKEKQITTISRGPGLNLGKVRAGYFDQASELEPEDKPEFRVIEEETS